MKTLLLSVLLSVVVLGGAFGQSVDGIVKKSEYARQVSADNGNVVIAWTIKDDRVFFGLDFKAKGWIAIGFDPTSVMANADMVFGMVPESGPVEAIDAYSTGTFGPHPPDAQLGGAPSVLQFAGSRQGDRIHFEFVRLLKTGDRYDKDIPSAGKLKIIWAYGPSMSFTAKHSKAGSVTVTME
jgi:hypothetical protein